MSSPSLAQAQVLAQQVNQNRPQEHNWTSSHQLDSMGRPLKLNLTGTTALASLPENSEWQRQNPDLTILRRYRGPATQGTGSYQLGESIRDAVTSPSNMWRRNMQGGPLRGTLVGGGVGGLMGGALGAILGLIRGSAMTGLSRGALVGGAAGGLLGGVAGNNLSKQASTGSAREAVVDALRRAPGLSFAEKSRLQQGVGRLSESDAQTLIRLLQTAGGGAIGALIARFLMDKGLAGTLVGAITGGVIGRALTRPGQTNAFGQRVQTGLNAYGQHF